MERLGGGVDGYLAAYRLHGEAKGATMGEEYQKERDLMKKRYPELVGRKGRHTLGRVAYYAAQLMSGRAVVSRRENRRYGGVSLTHFISDLAQLGNG